MIDPKLSGKVAIVTGANQGIGEATARALAAEGVAVLVHGYRMDPGEHAADEAYPTEYGELRARAPEEVASAIRHSGNRAVAVEADLSDPSAPRALFDLAEANRVFERQGLPASVVLATSANVPQVNAVTTPFNWTSCNRGI